MLVNYLETQNHSTGLVDFHGANNAGEYREILRSGVGDTLLVGVLDLFCSVHRKDIILSTGQWICHPVLTTPSFLIPHPVFFLHEQVYSDQIHHWSGGWFLITVSEAVTVEDAASTGISEKAIAKTAVDLSRQSIAEA
ncbi:hypothetical protein OIU79_008594 [Salix purpurea]|uniref:Uncharacterized protein n=1 Tax=Salix purpurea TaxID=77065 RepID=A0A9Q0TIR5_SALPP|nr:hypothetical protein OIU79_008594 [Salix purpurea]